MKVFNRTSLPEQINYNNKIYVKGKKTEKSVQVNVLSKNLKGRTDLHNKPTIWFYNPIDLNK